MRTFLSLLLLLTAIAFTASAQSPATVPKSVPAPTSPAPLPSPAPAQLPKMDVGGTANSILGKLTPALGLTDTQKPGVLNAVTGFLKDKSGILGLAKTDKAGYASKLSGLQGGLFGKLKTLLTASQYTKFLGLKPKTNDVTNSLSQLFF